MAKTIHRREYRALMRSLRQLREEAGVSQVQLAKRIGRSQTFISEAEGGQRRLDLIQLYDVCRALDISFMRLVRDWHRALETGRAARAPAQARRTRN